MRLHLLDSQLQHHCLHLVKNWAGRQHRRWNNLLTISAFFLLLASAPLHAQVKLWGLATSGGQGYGSIFNLNLDGSDFSAYAPPGFQGRNPERSNILKASNGKFYGMTNLGGNDDSGVLFEYDPVTATYTLRHSFEYNASGGSPIGSLIESGGKLYGMTAGGGNNDGGVIFEFDPAGAGAYTVLYHFDLNTGVGPQGTLLELGGKFYGTAGFGGSGGVGVLFEFDPSNNTYTPLHDFQYGNGSFPYASPIVVGGKLYGATIGGGVSDIGVLYEFDLSTNTYTVLHNFDLATGAGPYGSLVESDGKFYGMTNGGGDFGIGVVYEYDPAGAGTYTALHHFDFVTGGEPFGDLLLSGGKFYGVTSGGGIHGEGVLFEYDPSGGGTFTMLRNFDYDTGSNPRGSLVESDGKFYGMTKVGGSEGSGVVFEYNPSNGDYTVLVIFDKGDLGNDFQGRLILSGDKIYGVAQDGGIYNDGVLFEYDPAGSGTYTVRHHFNDLAGNAPSGGLTESGGKFYGTTRFGGTDDYGTLFEFDPASNTHTVLHNFIGTDGDGPASYLLEVGGKFYGTARSGGDTGDGVLFEYDPAGGGTFTVLHHFEFANGTNPVGGLTELGGKFYGATVFGGDYGSGVLYEYDPAGGGAYTVLHHFDYTNDGSDSYSTLLVSGGKLYGVANTGGNNDVGVLFEYDPAGAYTALYHFEYLSGAYPRGSLIEVDGKFYGTTEEGGDYDGGVVYEYNPVGSVYTVLKNLESADGTSPESQLLAVGEPSNTTPSVSGKLIWERDDVSGVGNATVALSGDQSGSITTIADGLFSFTLSSGADVTITPSKTINKLNGLTAADVTRIQRHVANIEVFTDPYLMVAADVNKSNTITTIDASLINQALLGSPSALAQIKTSWRFVPQSYTMNMPPWGFPENLSFSNVTGSLSNQNFIGIKTGDVTGVTANPANVAGGNGQALVLTATDQALTAGTEVTVSFTAAQFDALTALQFALKFDVTKLALKTIEPLGGLPVSADNFGTYQLPDGEILVVWAQALGVPVAEAAPVFNITFQVLQTGGKLSEALQLADELLPGYAYTSALTEHSVQLEFAATTGVGEPGLDTGLNLLQNRPNPFVATTTIGFVLPEACEAQLRVFDASGRELFAQRKNYSAGKHEEIFEAAAGVSGVLWYELTTPQGVLTRKMTVLQH